MSKLEEFLTAWRTRFPRADIPPNIVECLSKLDDNGLQEVYRVCKRRIETLQNELHQQEFLATFLWDVVKIDKSSPSSPNDNEGDLDMAIPVPDFSPGEQPGSYDNIENQSQHMVQPDPKPVQYDDDSYLPSQILRPQKPVPAPRPSTHVPSVKERASVFMTAGSKDPPAPPPKLPTRGNSLDSKASPTHTRDEPAPLPTIAPKRTSRPDPPVKPRKPVHNYEEIELPHETSNDSNHKPKTSSFRKQNSVESNSFRPIPSTARSPSGNSLNTEVHFQSGMDSHRTSNNYENVTSGVSSFKPHSKPKTSSLSPQLRRASPIYSSKHKRENPLHRGEEIYDEPIPVKSDSIEDDGSSSDEEPIYHNLMLMKKQQQSMDNRLYSSVNIHKMRLERDAKKLSHRFSLQPEGLRKTAKPVKPPVMRPLTTKSTMIAGVCEEESTTETTDSGVESSEPRPSKRCDSVESFGSGDRSLDSAGSGGSAADDRDSWRKRHPISKASSQESIFSEEVSMNIEAPIYAETEKIFVRKNVVQSILESEKAYTKTLDVLNQYMNSLLGVVDKPLHQIIPKEDIDTIFFGIPKLHEIHLEFIQSLKPRMGAWTSDTQVADLFKLLALEECQIAPKYLENYQRAITAIHKCSQDPRFRDLITQIKVVGVKEAPSLEELLHKPVVRFQRNTLVLHDLIGCTPISHPDYDLLQKTLKIAQNFLETFQAPPDKEGSAESQRYLARYSPIVEKVGNNRKLRHVFLFNDIIVCSKQKISGKRMQHEVKWAIALLDLTLDDRFSEEDHQVASHRMDIGEQQRVIAEVQGQLKQEMKKIRGNNEGHSSHRSWSIRSHNKNIEKLKKKLLELEAHLVLSSPHLHFRLKNGKNSKTHTLLLSSDYERTNWRDAVIGLKCKVTGSVKLHESDLNSIINTVKLPKLASANPLETDDSWLFEEEQLFGCLSITIHRLVGLKASADTYICVELDSFGHFFLKAKTETIHKTKEPCWDKDFELDLEGAQTLRLLCYKVTSPAEILLGKCALELSKAWLRGDYQEQNIPINDEMSISVSLRYATREKSKPSTMSKVSVFGADINSVAKREGKDIPIIVAACAKEVERRGLRETGIYRVSGLSSDIVELKNAFDKNSRGAVSLLQEFEINVVASLLKQYLRDLPEPLLTDALYPRLVQGMQLTDPEGKEKYLLGLIHTLQPITQHTLVFLLDHMLKIAEHCGENKMSLHNMATVFGPTLLQPTSKSDVPITMELFSENAKQAMAQTGILLNLLQLRQRGWDQNTKL